MDNQYDDQYDDQYDLMLEEDIEIITDAVCNPGDQVEYFDLSDIPTKMQQDVDQVSELLCIPKYQSIALLRRFQFDKSQINEEWFSNQDKLSVDFGFAFDIKVVNSDILTCGICFDDFSKDDIYVSPCGHSYCYDCWRMYLTSCIRNNGVESLFSHCPECKCYISDDIFFIYLKDDVALSTYQRIVNNAYIELSKERVYCINKDCNCYLYSPGGCKSVVRCKCGTNICFSCKEEPHSPCTCQMVSDFKRLTQQDWENNEWLYNNTKPCPKCHNNIEKNGGCMHMSCRSPGCHHEFCWMCLEPWFNHTTVTHSLCNSYDVIKDPKLSETVNKKIDEIRQLSQRSLFYLRRFQNQEESINQTNKLIPKFRAARDILIQDYLMYDHNVSFIDDLIKLILQNRVVLKWSYPYAFYTFFSDNNETNQDDAHRKLFEIQQQMLEMNTESLQELLEIKSESVFDFDNFDMNLFDKYRHEVLNHIESSSHYINNFLSGIKSI